MAAPVFVEGWRTKLAKQAEEERRRISRPMTRRALERELHLLQEAFSLRTGKKAHQKTKNVRRELRNLRYRIAFAESAERREKRSAHLRVYRPKNRKKLKAYHARYMRERRKRQDVKDYERQRYREWCNRNRERYRAYRRVYQPKYRKAKKDRLSAHLNERINRALNGVTL